MSKKDVLDEILEDENEGSKKELDADEIKTRLDELEKANKELEKKNMGLLNETKAQRRKRQEAEGNYNNLAQTVEGLLQQRGQATPDMGGEVVPEKITLEYDDDGNAVLDTNVLAGVNRNLEEKIANLEALLQATVTEHDTASQAQQVMNAIVGEDERYGAAYNKYQGARKWIEDKVVEFQNYNNIQGQMSSGQALDHVFDESLENEFKSQFPGLDLERVITAEDSQRHFRNALAHISDASSPDTNEADRTKRMLGKPSTLGTQTNAKGADLDMQERLANINTEDVLGLSDAQAAQLEKALARMQ